MRLLLVSPAFILLAACGAGESNPDQNILEATEQMDPAAAVAVENAVANGADPQNALVAGGAAQANTPDAPSENDVQSNEAR